MFIQLGQIIRFTTCLVVLCASVSQARSDELKIGNAGDFIPLTPDKPYLHVMHDGRSIKVQRAQDPDYQLQGYFAKSVRKCPPFCIQPITPDARVQVVGEIELFEFMESDLRDGKGLLIDARTPEWFRKETIPGSVNYPFEVFAPDSEPSGVDELLETLGAVRRGVVGWWTQLMEEWKFVDSRLKTAKWDFTSAKKLVIFCNGPACGQSPRAIHGLLAAGYPGDKLRYYRGGMQMWKLWGLTTVVPQ